MAVYLPYFIVTTHTHVYFRDITRGRMETQHGPAALLPFPIAFTTSLLVPQSALTLPGALSLLCPTPFCFLEVLPPSIYLSSYHLTSKTSLSFYVSIYFLLFRHESFVLYMVEHKQSQPTRWQNPTTKHTQGWAALESETSWRTAVRANREWDSHQ